MPPSTPRKNRDLMHYRLVGGKTACGLDAATVLRATYQAALVTCPACKLREHTMTDADILRAWSGR